MREVGAFEAKNKLSELLDLAERGEEIVITRHGKEVARLVPPKGQPNREEARAAMAAIAGAREGSEAEPYAGRRSRLSGTKDAGEPSPGCLGCAWRGSIRTRPVMPPQEMLDASRRFGCLGSGDLAARGR